MPSCDAKLAHPVLNADRSPPTIAMEQLRLIPGFGARPAIRKAGTGHVYMDSDRLIAAHMVGAGIRWLHRVGVIGV